MASQYEVVAIASGIAAIVGSIGAVITNIIQSMLRRRAESGSVETSDAQTLFNYSAQIINTLSTMTNQLWGRIDNVIGKMDATHKSVSDVIDRLHHIIALLEKSIQDIDNDTRKS